MKFNFKNLALCAIVGAGLGIVPSLASSPRLPPERLRDLAARASERPSWAALRQDAEAESDPEWRGWALFVLGYQELQQQAFPSAAEDLAQAAQTGFTFADHAIYYQASALSASSRWADAATLLADFATHFPRTLLRDQAEFLQADSLMKAHQPEKVVEILSAEPSVRKQPSLALLLANAYLQTGKLNEAAAAFQSLYYKFPLASQSSDADEALKSLRLRMGATYPAPLTAWRIARAEALYKGSRYAQALSDYRSLLADDPANAAASQWKLEEARCLWQLTRSSEAQQLLATPFPSPELEAQRLALMVRTSAQRQDAAALSAALDQLEASHTSSNAMADALSAAGMFYLRQLDWQNAARNYRRLWELFPQDSRLRDDGWRLAWCDYLLGDPATPEVMRKWLTQFPDAARAPAALYWLGQVEEDQGNVAEARALFALLVKRFANTYYAPHAAAHLATLRTKTANSGDHPEVGDAPLAAALIPVISAPPVPPGIACAKDNPSDAAGPALILSALSLPDLAQDYLKAAITSDTPPLDLRILLAGSYSAQGNPASALFAAMRAAPGYSQMEFSDLPKEVWDYLYPQPYTNLIESQARANGLDPYLVMGLIRQESAYNPKALSNANARGLMQVLPRTAAETVHSKRVRAVGQKLYDPDYNVKVGCEYLAQLIKEFDGQVEYAVAAYNAGDFRVKDWQKKYTFRDRAVFLESIPIPATRSYVELVLRDAEVYRALKGGAPRFAQCSTTPDSKDYPPGK